MPQKVKKRTNTKPRKPRRHLKKSVKRGCLGILLFILLFVSLTVYECTRPAAEEGAVSVVATWVEQEPDGVDSLLAERIVHVMHTTPRIDTSRIAISIFDLERKARVLDYRSQEPMAPASCMKLLSAISALHALGTEHYFESRLYIKGNVSEGTLHGDVLLALDDDPEVTSLAPFAEALAQRGIRKVEGNCLVHLVYGDTLRQHPTAAPWDIPFRKLSLLLRGERTVLAHWRQALTAQHISTSQPLRIDSFPQEMNGYALVHTLTTPLLHPMLPMLTNSNNIKAEAIYNHLHQRQTRWEEVQPYSVRQFVEEELHVNPDSLVINDGSGLSPENRLTAHFLTRLLVYVHERPEILDPLIHQLLASPGERRGSLLTRMSRPEYRGRIFCKTGTLTTKGISSLSGYALGTNGRWYAFTIFNDDTSVYESRHFQDLICRELVR